MRMSRSLGRQLSLHTAVIRGVTSRLQNRIEGIVGSNESGVSSIGRRAGEIGSSCSVNQDLRLGGSSRCWKLPKRCLWDWVVSVSQSYALTVLRWRGYQRDLVYGDSGIALLL